MESGQVTVANPPTVHSALSEVKTNNKPAKNKNYININQLLSKGFKDDRLDEVIELCIETMSYDEQKREQTHSRHIIKENFGKLFQANCSIVEAFFLHDNQLPDLSIRVK